MKSSSLVYRSKDKLGAPLIFLLAAMLLLVNILLVQQNKKLKVLASRPDRALEVRPGTALPPLEGFDSDGQKHSINYGQDSRKTVLLVLSPRCHACEENRPNWEAIISGFDRRSFRLATVSLQSEGAREYVRQPEMDKVPVLTKIDPRLKVAYNLALTPQIILIDRGGKVEKVWTGVLKSEDKRDVELALGVRLP
jgi:hypothetical protein